MSTTTMRAFVILGPRRAEVRDVEVPVPRPGEVVVDVERVGVCGTDVEFWTGEMAYLATGEAAYPIRIGHEWSGTVGAVGAGVDRAWLGRRVTGDTMLGCGLCARCRSGRQHLCADRFEVGIRRGWPGALAEKLPIPARFLRELPPGIDVTAGALAEPAGNAWRAVQAASVARGERLLVIGPGTIGLLAALIAAAGGADVHLLGRGERSIAFARSLGFEPVWSADRPPDGLFDAVIDASTDPGSPARAVELAEPGRRVVLIGISGGPSLIDSRQLALKDLTTVGILSASPGLDGAIDLFASGRVDPRPIVAGVAGLDDVAGVLDGRRDTGWGAGPKIHVDPRR
ncbi:MAG TPA: alcohol dehydrogenase catalytic domain-containing protein [Candidatus Limnocylindrales bacterium]